MNQTEIQVMITSGDMLPKVKSLLSQTQTVSTIVYITGKEEINTESFPQSINLISLREIERIGSESEFQFQIPKPDDTLIIMYTSGTTGNPKAAIATHRQFIGSAHSLLVLVKDLILDNRNHTYIAYLPLAHVLELTIEFFLFHGNYNLTFQISKSFRLQVVLSLEIRLTSESSKFKIDYIHTQSIELLNVSMISNNMEMRFK